MPWRFSGTCGESSRRTVSPALQFLTPNTHFALRAASQLAMAADLRGSTGAGGELPVCDGQHKYAYNFAIREQFAREAGCTDVRHISAEHGVSPRRYGKIELGNEPEGSLVVELRKS